jgi:hypothetical protein
MHSTLPLEKTRENIEKRLSVLSVENRSKSNQMSRKLEWIRNLHVMDLALNADMMIILVLLPFDLELP